MNLTNMNKMLKCAGNDDIVTLKAEDQPDVVTFMFESPSTYTTSPYKNVAQPLFKTQNRMLSLGYTQRPLSSKIPENSHALNIIMF